MIRVTDTPLPINGGTVGIVYDTRKFATPVTSWASLFEPDAGVKFLYFDSEREMIGAALRYLGHSLNSLEKKELQAAG
jgi:spermidine/putrescine transport system substrate-binding protein